jgi:hypothetical protein
MIRILMIALYLCGSLGVVTRCALAAILWPFVYVTIRVHEQLSRSAP